MSNESQPQPFRIDIDDATIDWIQARVRNARIVPDVKHPKGMEWADGVPGNVMDRLVKYWREEYDWRKVEAKLNSTYKMFTLDIPEGNELIKLHYVHHRSDRADAIPLLFLHGWPGNFTEVEYLLSLTKPEDPSQQAFHVIAPSLPGFVFSSSPKEADFSISKIGSICNQLMFKLGYTRYIGQGGDWGSFILRSMASSFPKSCIGIHINFLAAKQPSPFTHPLAYLRLLIGDFTPDQKKRIERGQWFFTDEWGYSEIAGTKPQTLAYSLTDSPIGMLSWLFDKMTPLVQPGYVWEPEKVITWVMLYLLSGSSWHARIYKYGAPVIPPQNDVKIVPGEVEFGASCFPYDIGYIPIWWAKAELAKNIIFWKEHSKGGHFAATESPEVLKADIREFVERLSDKARKSLKY
ncbi:Putative epoxide hydrolase [Psilocybe cubensis]|uniref:Epoxide hydrolase n=2 Tax=Psilocybe cubensis TaxID=181762 RepID=A0ACB8GPW0_PSICU|nr:Putative epoxide hydrolase [Psilocybe cubensis]KAH9477775.1 Putative epoxide hydrolase [Psilocybe cubensis]